MTMDTWPGVVAVIVCVLLAALIFVGLVGRRSWGYVVGACVVGVGLLGLLLLDPVGFITDVWTWGERMLADDPTLYGPA